MTPALEIEGLTLAVGGRKLVEDVSITVAPGEMVGLVGESGCGKSITALSVMRLLPSPPVRVLSGAVRVGGADVLAMAPEALRAMRGDRVGMIFQEPMTSLNPVFTVGDQIAEALEIHRGLSRRQALARAAELLALVGLPAPIEQLGRYPHQMSGGQRQRVMIAMALACEPKLLIADEPTTALDVTVQAQILALIDRLRREMDMGCLLITHDLGVVAEVCDRAAVMYAGRIVEEAAVGDLFAHPRHRYTRALIDTAPASNPPGTRLPSIAGMVPPPGAREHGCAFAPRCPAALPVCRTTTPALLGDAGHRAACWNPAPAEAAA
ncbi:peptide ABC transporter ATP-binding protein [Alsobacter metallidurans]|uniref:Peptide ABC transporter ATP-binding protein n=1 Tax=Alsobacter metallidurans TaxID=340221 RepID=A0A917MI75_9HYPH|nr:ABC transporter ATP-binding protein [Alsobacter metallidurans]GGH09150.1 peptide ABC transporter ATP-binding protein [Alsobacter metallidurans]